MRRKSVLITSVSAALLAGALQGRAGAPAPPIPVLVELFTSEGCSSCPAADGLLESFVATQSIDGAEVIGLGHHVDYWDQLGWRDRFSSGAATNRQRRYGQVFNVDAIYTPQMVVDGREEFVGSDARRARRAIGDALTVPHALVTLAIEPVAGDRVAAAVRVADLPKLSRGDRADVIVAVTESQLRSDVRRGENRGRLLSHAPVVRQLTIVGDAAAGVVRTDIGLVPGWQRDHLTIIAFVQERFSRRVLGAVALPLQSARR